MIYKWWLQWGRSNNEDDLQMMTAINPIMRWFTNDDSNEVDPIRWWFTNDEWGRSNEVIYKWSNKMKVIYKWWLQWGRSNNDDDLQMMTPMR